MINILNEIAGKICFLGNTGVGKTSIVNAMRNQPFNSYESSTIGASFTTITKTVELENGQLVVRGEIWDTAGQERFRSLSPMYFKQSHIVVLVCSMLTHEIDDSIQQLCNNLRDIQHSTNEPKHYIVIFNKADNDSFKNDADEAQKRAQEIMEKQTKQPVKYIITSAKNNIGINDLRETLLRFIESSGIIRKPELIISKKKSWFHKCSIV